MQFLFNTPNAIMALVREKRGRQAEEKRMPRASAICCGVLEDVEAQEVTSVASGVSATGTLD